MPFDMIWFQNVVLPVLGMGMGTLTLIGVYRTINRALDRRHERLLQESGTGVPRGVQDQLDHLRARLEGLEAGSDRLQELEERMDFTERVIAGQRDQTALGGGA